MADEKTKTTGEADATAMPKKLPAVTEIQAEANEAVLASAADQPETAALATDIEDDGLDELPEGAVLAGGPTGVNEAIAAATSPRVRPQAPFSDDHVGRGGTYVVGDDGVRRVAYEAYRAPAPGKKGEQGETVIKYRPVV